MLTIIHSCESYFFGVRKTYVNKIPATIGGTDEVNFYFLFRSFAQEGIVKKRFLLLTFYTPLIEDKASKKNNLISDPEAFLSKHILINL